MAKKEYIERGDIEKWLLTETASLDGEEDKKCVVERLRNDIPAADVVDEENILKFYYVRSIDEYWIGQRIDNFYYAEYDPKRRQWVWTHSRHLPWGEHIVSPTSLWKEHTYPSEPEEMPFPEWLQGFIKKHAADVEEVRRLTGYDEGLIKDLEWYCRDHRHPKWTRELVKRAAESIAGKNEYRGRWETYKSGEHTECICSACKKSYYYHNKGQYQINKSRYCPNCGAKMDGGADDGKAD